MERSAQWLLAFEIAALHHTIFLFRHWHLTLLKIHDQVLDHVRVDCICWAMVFPSDFAYPVDVSITPLKILSLIFFLVSM